MVCPLVTLRVNFQGNEILTHVLVANEHAGFIVDDKLHQSE